MQSTNEFELAQKRLKDRQRNQSLLIFWSALFCIAIVINIIYGGIAGWWILLELFTLVMAIRKALQLRYSSPKRPIRTTLVEQEMNWLFGVDWRVYTSTQEYTFAQDRIRKRRLERWGLLLHLLIFIPGAAVALSFHNLFIQYGQPGGELWLAILALWLIFLLIPHTLRAFAIKAMLAGRERKVGQALQLELQRMQPEKLKNDEKLKRNVEYSIGDDGELVEVDPSEEDKPKRDRL